MSEASNASGPPALPSQGALERTARMPAARRYLMVELTVIALAVAIYVFGSDFQLELGATVMAYSLLALSMDFNWGCTGIMSLGQAFFFGVGAYVGGLLATETDISSALIALPAAVLSTFVFAVAVGAFLLLGAQRTTVLFVSIATLVLSFISQRIADAWDAIGAENGIPNIPQLTLGPLTVDVRGSYIIALLALAGAYVALQFVVRSQFGLVLVAVRDDEQRAMFLGYRPTLVKLFAFSVSGAVAGLGGVLYAFQQGFVSPTLLAVGLSTQAMLWVLIGGSGTLVGPVIGVILTQGLGQYLSQDMPKLWPIVLGVILLFVVLAVQRGVVGWFLPRAPIQPPHLVPKVGLSSRKARVRG
jgi:branched-chain amino acid transport system permease protein